MNLFILDSDMSRSVQALDDKRVVKMVLETAQILCTVLSNNGFSVPYRPTHKNHPVTLWVGASKRNLMYTWNYFGQILDEYSYRFNKQHKCQEVYDYISPYISQTVMVSDMPLEHTPFANCSMFKDESDVIAAYRKTMVVKWAADKRPPKWTNRQLPEWSNK